MLPLQRIPLSQKTEKWGKDTIDHYEMLTSSSTDSIRTSIYNKRINYDLANGKFNKKDLEYVCNPLGLKGDDAEYPATLQHYDIISPPLNLLMGEETKRPDNCIVVSESPNDINRKQQQLKERLTYLLQQHLIAEIDPSTVDPNQPLPTPTEVLKYEKHNVSDMIESQANKMFKFIKKNLNTKEVFKKGWGDALKVGEEIYWTGVLNKDIMFRRCNPLNITVILDGDSDFIDDAQAVTEIRMLTISTIIDEFGDILNPKQIARLEELGKRSNGFGPVSNNPTFQVDPTDGSITDSGYYGSSTTSVSQDLIRVMRVEWKSFKKLYHLAYTDDDGVLQQTIVDESFKINEFRMAFPDAIADEMWINEAWEGVKIHDDIYIGIQAKENQRRRMDNPYYCKLGYTGFIYNATNSQSVSLIDRLKPYQYLYNIISFRLELAFASDQGKVFLMDLAHIPRSEGIDIDRWMYYLKSMKIAFVNSFEESNKGTSIGKIAGQHFNQFQSVDLTMANSIQQYIQTLDYIKQQVAFISGVSPQRLGAIQSKELVGNVERSVQQSALITEHLFDSHDEVKRRVYTALVECAKIAFRDGKKAQFVLDDMGLEMLNIEELQFENSELNVYMSNSNKDIQIVETLKQLAQAALQHDKADLSAIIDTIINDNPRDIAATIKRGEEAKYAREKAVQEQQAQIEQQKIAAQKEMQAIELEQRQLDRDLEQYKIDTDNQTKIMVAEINALTSKEGPSDMDNDGIPDPIEVAKLSLQERDIASKAYMEQQKQIKEKEKHDRDIQVKDKELKMKKEVEDKKIEAIRVQNESQEKIQKAKIDSDAKLAEMQIQAEKERLKAEKDLKQQELDIKKKEMSNKVEIEKIKLAAAKQKAAADAQKQKLMLRKAAQSAKKPKKKE